MEARSLLTRETIHPRMPNPPDQGGRHRQNGGRLEIGTVGAIKSERRAPSDWNGWAAYVGIRRLGARNGASASGVTIQGEMVV